MVDKYQGVWRQKRARTKAFPKLMVDDFIMTGSINVSDSRLPLWAFITTAILEGWGEVESRWLPQERYGYKKEDLAHFLYCLLEQRGEFGRLLLVLANAESKSECWWDRKTHRKAVSSQLRRCLDTLQQVEEMPDD